ncbi:MAG: ABC transporter permease subunit [Candidatus Eisenbacteria bacterium]|nr:ABC transporter permease subunit [Candidatus Eisenbacteria bacterium]
MRLLAVTRLTIEEAGRRRVLHATLLCGAAFLVLYAIGFHYIVRGIEHEQGPMAAVQHMFVRNLFTIVGLYAVNFLMVMSAVLLPVDTLSGEIASGVLQTVVARPVHRTEIVLGKWLAYVLVIWGYLLLLAGGVLTIAYFTAHALPPRAGLGLMYMAIEAVVLVSLSIAGGARLGTVTNGVLAFGLYGLAFLGGWVEQIGSMANNEATRNIGTIASLLMPSESMWQLASHQMQPEFLAQMRISPFSIASVPSQAMVLWAVLWSAAVLASGVIGFRKRAL